ncbi:hypothetical protein RFI_02382 [Reticulomyxa filosa]|uniref:SUEL-type lectin domain-containing protein n=1 Tax=Reticulomyxa filosa TaxID=46433 RepID=X6PAN9_RETFI|nr:hypothetical protein RFI_02382 [Reticulomyxa filosa]|eukprot:ETO34712.1 hypothetical protein RFI_02382 [Reticulomyxa filosa]
MSSQLMMKLFFHLFSLITVTLSSVEVAVDWNEVIATSKTITTLQVGECFVFFDKQYGCTQAVVNPLLTRESLIHDQVFESLGALQASFVHHLNGDSNDNNWNVSLQCPNENEVIFVIDFASWGTPQGYCGNWSIGQCHASNSMAVAKQYCQNANACTIPVNVATFGYDPCFGTVKSFAIQVRCNTTSLYSNWDFTLLDPIMEDVMAAVNPTNAKLQNKSVINFSTIPNWKFANVTMSEMYVSYTDNPYDCSWNYNLGNAPQLTQDQLDSIGDYYGRLVSWYTQGGFYDEYDQWHASNHFFNIDVWEVLNEPESEHSNTPESYTKQYDAIVQGIRKFADPNKEMQFMGLALAYHNEWNWYSYFLNKSNHNPQDTPIDYISFHFYASCNSRTDPEDYEQFFPAVDTFVQEVQQIIQIRDELSPSTKLDIDEIGVFFDERKGKRKKLKKYLCGDLGVILPGDNANTPNPPDIYWNAAGGMYAYLFGQLSRFGVDVMGQSQLMGFPPLNQTEFPASPGGIPPQYASVTELSWTTGIGNARYWILKMLIDHFHTGDHLLLTNTSDSKTLFAQAFIDNAYNASTKRILFVNKLNQNIDILIDSPLQAATLYYIDESTGFGPAQTETISGTTFQLDRYGVGAKLNKQIRLSKASTNKKVTCAKSKTQKAFFLNFLFYIA